MLSDGPRFERDPILPERGNIGFAQITRGASLRLRVWERGAGLTLACGSGACAALVNAHRRGLLPREADVELDGGILQIAWREADGHVLMTGPVATAFHGQVELADYPP
jgi:diaminopimelate epimerase